jgi:hypothetical protein
MPVPQSRCALLMSELDSMLVGMGDRFDTQVVPILNKVQPNFQGPNWHGFSSMHGTLEVRADAWELCAQRHYPGTSRDIIQVLAETLSRY